MTRTLPAPKHVRDVLEELLGREVTVSLADPLRSAEMHRSVIGVYVDDGLGLSALVSLGFPLAVYTAAALGLVPPAGAEDYIEEQSMSPLLAENVAEILNILGARLNSEGHPHIRLYQTYLPGQALPADASGHMLALGRRLDLNVEVSGYGGGKLSISIVN